MDVLVLLWVAVPAVVMVHASVCDVRSREVPDIHWAVIGASGAILSTLSVRDVGALGAVSTMAGSLLLLAYMLSERLSGTVAVPVVAASSVLIIAPFAANPGNPFARAAVASFVTFFAMFAMYRIGLITAEKRMAGGVFEFRARGRRRVLHPKTCGVSLSNGDSMRLGNFPRKRCTKIKNGFVTPGCNEPS